MKRTIATTLVLSVLVSLTAAAGPIKGKEELSDILEKEVKIERSTEVKALTINDISLRLGSLARNGQSSSAASAGLTAKLVTNEGALDVTHVARSIILSDSILKNSNIIGNDLDAGAVQLKGSIEDAIQVYSSGLGLVAEMVKDANSDNAKAVAKVLSMGPQIARGQLSVEQAKSYTELMRSIDQMLRTGQAKTSEEALSKSLKQLGMDSEAKIKELIGCKSA